MIVGRALRRCGGLAAALALVFVLVAGAFSQPAAGGVFNPETFTLPNGLQVVVIPNHRAPIVTHMVWYRTGSADEQPGKSGIAHFLEHLMFKGTKSVAPGEFSKIVARNGGRDNAFTSLDYTAYFQNVARDRLEGVMRLEADRMSNLILTDAEVDPERDVILEERRSVLDNDPRARMREQMQAALYLNHPYGRSVIGWEHEMRGLNTADALDWYRRYYAPNNAILIVAGDITAADLKPLAEKYYGPISARPIAPRLRPQEPPPEAARRVTIKDTRVREPSLSRVYLAPSYVAGAREHAYPLEVLAEVLGSGGTSQLYRALVLDRRVATAAGAFYTPDAIDLTRFAMFATPAPGVSPADLEAALDEEIRRVLVEGVSAGDVERAKQRMRASAVFARDSLQTGARVIGTALAIGQTVDDVEAWPDRIGAVTAAEVTAAARYVLREERSVTGVLLPRPGS